MLFKNILIIGTVIGTALSLGACKKFLTKEPDVRQPINSVENVKDLLGTAYPEGAYNVFTEWSTDNMREKPNSSQNIRNDYRFPYIFQDLLSIGDQRDWDQPAFYWNKCYAAIAAANKALEFINSLAPEEAKPYLPYKGEALLCRAYAHFMLVTFFALRYDAQTADQTPGIPYVEEVESVAVKKYTRKTVAEVYENIRRDLETGLPLIQDGVYDIPQYHFTQRSAHAFAARFYLHHREWQKVVDAADKAFESDAVLEENMRDWTGIYRNFTPLEILQQYTRATEPANLLLVSAESNFGYFRSIFLNQKVGFSAEMLRSLFLNLPKILTSNTRAGTAIKLFGRENIYNIPKFNEYFRRSSINANTGLAYIMVPVFSTEEVLFNKAEAQLYLGKKTEALKNLNLWVKHRFEIQYESGPQPLSDSDYLTEDKLKKAYGADNLRAAVFQGDPNIAIYSNMRMLPSNQGKAPFEDESTLSLLKTILDLKRIEFYYEGIRWFDIMRYDLPVIHTLGEKTFILAPGSLQRAFQLPTATGISGLTPNPR